MKTLPADLEALMPAPDKNESLWCGRHVYTATQMREAILAATERAAKQRKDIEKALLWCVRNLTEYGHRRMLSDPSNGVMRAVEAIHAASLREGGSKPAQHLDGEAGEPT